MDWQEILTTIILSVVGAIVSGIGAFVMAWIRSKIKNDKLQVIFDDAYRIVHEGVAYVYQTYVNDLKGTDLWDKEAMNKANQKAVEYIKKNLSTETIAYVEKNGKILEEWIQEQIEVAIQERK